jgi:transcriptional regulator with XRE-family HTH domain
MKGADLKALRESLNLTQQEFASKLGLSTRTVQNWEGELTTITKGTIKLIEAMFPEKKDGPPIEKNNSGEGIPVLAGVHTTGTVVSLFKDEHDEKPLFYLDAPEIKGCDYGVRVIGDSMYPLIRNGGYVACKTITNKEHILFGEIFHVITADYSTVKYIKKHPDKKDWVLLVPYNDKLDPTPMPKSEIIKLAQVRAILQVI